MPIFFLVIMIIIIVSSLSRDAVECLIALGIIATGLPVYTVLVAWKNKPAKYQRFLGERHHLAVVITCANRAGL